jgi:hypothetical protein
MTATAPTSLAGQTLRWKFEDSPTGKGTYEHTFDADGSVSFSMLDGETKGEKKGKPTRVKKYASFAVAPAVQMVSYLSPESGYTLTVAMNFETHRIYGFASNEKEWHPLSGTMEVVK